MDKTAVLSLFDRQLRRGAASGDPSIRVERDGRLVVVSGESAEDWSAVVWSDLDEETADEEIARGAERLRGLGPHAEWKLYAHDRPADLAQRLVAAGFEPDEEESVLVADLAELGPVPELPAGVEVRAATTPDEVAAIVALQERVFGGGQAVFGRLLERALERDPPWALGVVALADGQPVSAGRVEFNEGSDFAGLWGGGTDPAWRGRGLYRATVAFRAELARERGYRYVQVDALPTSRPILERLGFVELTRTTPYRPPPQAAPAQTVPAQTAGRSL